MASSKKQPTYRLEEPSTGLYLVQRADGKNELGRERDATRFATRDDALIAASRLEQPHALVRVDA